jgi:hypothetical protein
VKTVFDPRRLRSLQPFSLEQSLDGALRLFEYEIDAPSFLRVRSANGSGEGLHAEVVPIPTTVVPASVAGSIDEDAPSLFQSIETAGEQPDLAIAMAQIFGGEIDFNTELQPGDRYTVAFDRLEREERRSSYGAITAAEFRMTDAWSVPFGSRRRAANPVTTISTGVRAAFLFQSPLK